MANKPVHTVKNQNGGWDNKREGASRASSHADTKAEAVLLGRELARNGKTEHFIHNMDSKFGERNSYGNDPHPPKG